MAAVRVLLFLLLAAVTASGARAQSVADFYKGKTIEVYIGFTAGGGYDAYARLLARYMSSHIPGNPTVVRAATATRHLRVTAIRS